jgi:hypothetical protein
MSLAKSRLISSSKDSALHTPNAAVFPQYILFNWASNTQTGFFRTFKASRSCRWYILLGFGDSICIVILLDSMVVACSNTGVHSCVIIWHKYSQRIVLFRCLSDCAPNIPFHTGSKKQSYYTRTSSGLFIGISTAFLLVRSTRTRWSLMRRVLPGNRLID